MQTDQMILASQFCIYHNIEGTFIDSLYQSGLIELTRIEEEIFIPESQLKHVEKLVHFNVDLDINLEGIETISHLLRQIEEMQEQILVLRNKIEFYQTE